MKLSIGIIGLPNVGKSTLFNALLKKSPFAKASAGQAGGAKIGNYPFTTIDPNIGIVEVPDERLPVLAKIVNIQKIVPAAIEFYDIAGLVKGASYGEGLGNQFLSHIREVAAIIHVVRLFEDENVAHVSEKINPEEDIKTIEMELMLADLQTLEKVKSPSFVPHSGTSEGKQKSKVELVDKLINALNKGVPARDISLSNEELELLKPLNLLTLKPVIYVFNVSEKQLVDEIASPDAKGRDRNDIDINFLYLCAKMESEIVIFSEEEQKKYLKEYGLEETGLNRLITLAYQTLNLISFFTTTGGKEVRAWTIKKGTLAPQAGGTVHTDFEEHFIKADVISYQKFIEAGGWTPAREKGFVQTMGRDYEVRDGDVIEFKVGV